MPSKGSRVRNPSPAPDRLMRAHVRSFFIEKVTCKRPETRKNTQIAFLTNKSRCGIIDNDVKNESNGRDGGIGRRTWLRAMRSLGPCGFKSRPRHQKIPMRPTEGVIFSIISRIEQFSKLSGQIIVKSKDYTLGGERFRRG